MIHQVETIRDAAGEAEILLDQNHCHATTFQSLQHLADALHDYRRKPFGRLIEQENLDPCAQDARHGQHLLFAAGKLGAGARPAFVKIGKQLVDFIERHAAGCDDGRKFQIFLDAQCREDAALFRHETESVFRRAMQRHRHQILAAELDHALAVADDAHNGAQRRGLANPIAPENGDGFAFADGQIDAVQRPLSPYQISGWRLRALPPYHASSVPI